MLITIPYDRERAVAYARRWALDRNPTFFDFTGIGGNCTNFVSQCIFAGCGVMNFTKTFGWYYLSPDDRAPAWSGVDELYDFLIGAPDFIAANGGIGPFASDASVSRMIELGDVIQLSNESGEFYHTLIICGFTDDDILVCAHSDDALDRRLSTYRFSGMRILHIEGARVQAEEMPPNEETPPESNTGS
ncbi:MAG: amidase [Ruminococcaceae bacterium]|nr:amidase [Oscillospiraceae bacterium]